jgi:hypothetical protein
MFNLFPTKYYAPDSAGLGMAAAGAANPYIAAGEAALGAIQTGIGIVNSIGQKKRINKLIDKLNPYTTPDAFYQGLNLTESRAQGDTVTRQFQQDQLDNAFAGYLGAATNLGADANQLSAAFGQKIQGLMQVGQQFHQSNTEAFSAMLAGFNALAENKTAEQVSKNNLIKNRIQAENANFKTANDNIGNGLNTFLASLSSKGMMDLFKQSGGNADSGYVAPLATVGAVGSNVSAPAVGGLAPMTLPSFGR